MRSTTKSINRADKARQKRTSRTRKQAQAGLLGRDRRSQPAAPPPVMVRNSRTVVATREPSTKKKAKRRYDVALNNQGVEIRLPSLPSISLGWRLLSGMLVIGLAFSLYTLWDSPMYRVEAAEVDGVRRLSSHDINVVAGLSGQSIFQVDPLDVQTKVEKAFPELASVAVEVRIPATVSIKVNERQPVLTWEHEGEQVWVDVTGASFPARSEDGPAVLVKAEDPPPSASTADENEQARNVATERFLPPQLVSAVLTLSFQAPENTPLIYSSERGLGWVDKRGWEAYFGLDVEDMEMKLRFYKTIVKRLLNEKVKPSLISVEYVHAPYYRLEP